MNPDIITTFGLGLDIVGAIYISCELKKFFKGKSHRETLFDDGGNPPTETDEYKNWKSMHLKIGLIILCLGFFLQIIAIWI